MKKFLFLILMFLFIPTVKAEKVNIYLFYGEGCSHCAALEKYLETKDNINLYKYEIWFNSENEKLLKEVSLITKMEPKGVPYYIIGNNTLQGYNDTKSWQDEVDKKIEKALKEDYTDEVGIYLGKVEKKEITKEEIKEENVVSKENVNNAFDKKTKYILGFIIIADIVVIAIYIYKKTKKRL